jgi:hypothetical protein
MNTYCKNYETHKHVVWEDAECLNVTSRWYSYHWDLSTVEPRLSELHLTETRVNRNAFCFVREMISKLNC